MAMKLPPGIVEIACSFTGGRGANVPFRNAGYAPTIGYVGS